MPPFALDYWKRHLTDHVVIFRWCRLDSKRLRKRCCQCVESLSCLVELTWTKTWWNSCSLNGMPGTV
jgi:hypothetical protein